MAKMNLQKNTEEKKHPYLERKKRKATNVFGKLSSKKSSRLELRLSAEEKENIMKAVDFFQERGISEFILKRIRPDVEKAIESEKQIKLSNEAWVGFLDLLNNKPKASDSLKDAMKSYLDSKGN